MRKHGGTPSGRDTFPTLAANSPPGVAQSRFIGGHQSGIAGCKPPALFMRGAFSCTSQGQRQQEPQGASARPSAPTYLPSSDLNYPNGEDVALPFFLDGDAIDYYHCLTKNVQDHWDKLIRVLGQCFKCISHEPMHLSRMLRH